MYLYHGKADLHDWKAVLDRLDTILEACLAAHPKLVLVGNKSQVFIIIPWYSNLLAQ